MKYMGSKRRISKYILPIILKNRKPGQWYVEPFCGGCNLIDKVDGPRMANDINRPLIEMFKALQSGCHFPDEISKDQYMTLKEAYEEGKFINDRFLGLIGWVGFTASYNGKFFDSYVNESGGRNYQREAQKNILNQVKRLSDVVFTSGSFTEMQIPEESIIYCDIPYRETTSYKAGGLDYDAFYTWAVDMANKGHKVYVSEYSIEHPNFVQVWEMDVKNELNRFANGGDKGYKTERLYRVLSDEDLELL